MDAVDASFSNKRKYSEHPFREPTLPQHSSIKQSKSFDSNIFCQSNNDDAKVTDNSTTNCLVNVLITSLQSNLKLFFSISTHKILNTILKSLKRMNSTNMKKIVQKKLRMKIV